LADVNGDASRDALDIGGFMTCLLGVGTDCTCADTDDSGGVDLADITVFVDTLLSSSPDDCTA